MHRSWKNTVGETQNLQILEEVWRIMGQVQLSIETSPLLLVFIQSSIVISVPKLNMLSSLWIRFYKSLEQSLGSESIRICQFSLIQISK